MAQSATHLREEGVLDMVITNATIIDYWGIVKADIGIKDGKICGIGKAGNPNTMEGVTSGMVIGASTEALGVKVLSLLRELSIRTSTSFVHNSAKLHWLVVQLQ